MKKWWMLGIASILSIPFALAGFGDTLKSIWEIIISVGDLSAFNLPDATIIEGFTRILIWILMFTVFFGVLTGLGGERGPLKWLGRRQAGIVGFVIATISFSNLYKTKT